jgi:hypothetical protein
MDKKLKSEISKASKAIRKKYLALRQDRFRQAEVLKKSYTPISKPLEELVKTIKHKNEYSLPIEKIEKAEAQTSTPVETEGPRYLPDDEVLEYDPFDNEQSAREEKSNDPFDNEQSDSKEKSVKDLQKEYETIALENPNAIQEYLEQYDELPRSYIEGFLNDTKDNYDTSSHGVRFSEIGKWFIGNGVIELKEKKLLIKNIEYKSTPGIFELLFKKYPIGYTQDDQHNYKDILERTSAHRRQYDPKLQIQGRNSYKYLRIIKPLFDSPKRHRHSTWDDSFSRYGEGMIVENRPHQFVFWNDCNELVERLRLLYASKQSGNNSHNNEITALIEELREANIIE